MQPAAALLRNRTLVAEWIRREWSSRYRRGPLTFLLPLARPALMLGIYGVIFSRALKVDVPGNSYVLFALCGLAPWVFFSVTISQTAYSLTAAGPIVRKVYFPRAVVPVAYAAVATFDLALVGSALVATALITQGAIPVAAISLLPLYAGYVILMAAVGIVVALAGALSPAFRTAVPMMLQLAFIASPIMYPPRIMPRTLAWLTQLNPVAAMAEITRDALIEGTSPRLGYIATWLVAASLVFLAALMYSSSIEHRIADA